MSIPNRPPFSSLPLDKSGPRGNAWHLYQQTQSKDSENQLGSLNLLTPERTAAVAQAEIRTGRRICTDLPLDFFGRHPLFGREMTQHRVKQLSSRSTNDDVLTMNTQASTQWDGFRHFGWQEDGRYLNGHTNEDVTTSDVLGMNAWVKNGAIAGRGVLLDYYTYAQEHHLPVTSFKRAPITVSTLEAIAAHQGVTFQRGDLLFLRTGFVRNYQQLSEEGRADLAADSKAGYLGVENSEETLKWLWEREFAAVAGDHPTFEAWPCRDPNYFLHEWLLAGWGTPIGELFNLEELSDECERQKRWSFFFSSVPLHASSPSRHQKSIFWSVNIL